MSIEGMWAVYFGDVAGVQVNSGIAVFETGRIFGGDSMMAYLGNYSVNNSSVAGELRVWAYNPHQQVVTAFGKRGTTAGDDLSLEGQLDAGTGNIVGQLWETKNPDSKIPATLIKVSDLPG